MNTLRLSAVLATCLVSACASYGPQSLGSGASLDATTRAMGAPTSEAAIQGGGRRLEYARGPFGRHTYMLEFDAQGQLVRWEQVLNEAHFNAIRTGMDSESEKISIPAPSSGMSDAWADGASG